MLFPILFVLYTKSVCERLSLTHCIFCSVISKMHICCLLLVLSTTQCIGHYMMLFKCWTNTTYNSIYIIVLHHLIYRSICRLCACTCASSAHISSLSCVVSSYITKDIAYHNTCIHEIIYSFGLLSKHLLEQHLTTVLWCTDISRYLYIIAHRWSSTAAPPRYIVSEHSITIHSSLAVGSPWTNAARIKHFCWNNIWPLCYDVQISRDICISS